MSLSLPTRLLASALLLTAAVTAQTVVVRGELVSGRATGCYYCPSVDFAIKYSEMPVHSSTINLTPYLDLHVELIGNWNGSAGLPALDVTAVQLVTETLSISGQGRIGDRFRFTAHGTAGDLAINTGSLGRGFLNPFGTLSYSLDAATMFLTGVGVLDSAGQFRTETPIPNDPSLVGLHVLSQSLIVPANGVIFSTNPRANFVQ